MDNSATQEFEFLDFTDINDMERGRLLHMLYSARNESWVSGEDGFKHPDFPWTFGGTQPQATPPGLINEVGKITHISDWNTAADEYDCGYPTVNGDAEPENPVMINGENVVPGSPPPVYQMVPNPPVYMGNVSPPVHGYVPSQMSPYQQPMYPGPEPKKKKEPAPNIPSDVVQEIQKTEKEETKTEDITPVVEFKEDTPLNQEQASSSSIPQVVIPEVKDTEPVKPVFKTWAGLFTGCASTSNDKVFTIHGSSQPTTNKNTKSIIMPSRTLPDNTVRTSVFVTNNNQKQTLPVKPRPSSSNSISSIDDNTLNLQRLGEFLSVYNLNHKTAYLQPRGLTNRNTRCYINATLQALLTCPPFFNLMRSVQFKLKNRNNRGSQKSQTPILESMIQFIGEFQKLSIQNGRTTQQQRQATSVATQETPDTGPAFEPSYVYKILPAFEEGRQEDAEEFMSYLLNGINDEIIELIKMSKSNISNGETQAKVDAIDNNNEWKEVNGKRKRVTRRTVMEKTPLSEIFRGQLRIRTVKTGENEPTENIEPFFTLKLDIEKAKSVREALHMLVNKVTIKGLTCPKTNRELAAYQQVTIDELPYVLLLHLKCFEYKQQKLTKIVKNVEFSVDLKIEPRLISKNYKISSKTRQYKLFAVVYHDGKEANKGHYFADVFYVALGRWIRFDDANVRFVTDKEVCQPKPPCMPYLLYYRRNDTIAALSAFDNKGR
ncbi:unnamed protein product [Macrosiphum euphorbiae]|nr:unnamed protein product [Macrosiphum euphorbiae]